MCLALNACDNVPYRETEFLFTLYKLPNVVKYNPGFNHHLTRDGNGVGWGRRIGSSPLSHIVLSWSIPALSHMTEKFLLPHPHPLGPHKASSHPVKLYFLLICPQLLLFFFLIKPISLIKICLKLQINSFRQIKLIFSKN